MAEEILRLLRLRVPVTCPFVVRFPGSKAAAEASASTIAATQTER